MKTKNSKKVLALILSFFMILTVLPFNVMAEDAGTQPKPAKTTAELKQEALAKIGEVETKLKPELEKVKDTEVKKHQTEALTNVVNGTKEELGKIQDAEEVSVAQPKIDKAMKDFVDTTNGIAKNVQAKLEEEKKTQEQKEQEESKKVQDAKAKALKTIEAKEKEVKAKVDSIKDQPEKEKQQKALKDAFDVATKAVNDVADTSKPEDAEKTINAAVTVFETKAKEVETAATAQLEKEKKAEEAKELEEAKKAANTELEKKATDRKAEIDKLDSKQYDIAKSKAKVEEALKEAKAEVAKAATKEKVTEAKDKGLKAIGATNFIRSLSKLKVSANVYYDAITGKVTDVAGNPVAGATVTVSVFGRMTTTDSYGNFSLNMSKESGNYYCGYYGNKGYTWNNYPYNSSKITTTTGSYSGYNNSSYARYFFLVDANGAVVDSVYANAYANYYLRGDAYKTYTVYSSEYGYNYGYNYGYPYYNGNYNKYYNPSTSWAYGKELTAVKNGYESASTTLGYVTNYQWLYTSCYEYGYPNYKYDRVIYPKALGLNANGTIVSGRVEESYLPIYVYRNGEFLGSGKSDANGYFSIGLNRRVNYTSELTFFAYGKDEKLPQKKAEHGTIPVKTKVVIGSQSLIKNINGIETEVKMDVAPFIKDGRTMLPLRFIAEALGFKVEWNHAARTVILTDKEFKVEIPVNTNKIIVNGSTYYSDVKPVLKNNRTMLPVANIARALGLKDGTDIIWDASARVATIMRSVKY